MKEHDLTSVMNTSKWSALLEDLQGIRTEKRIQFVDSPEPTKWQTGLWSPARGYIESSLGPERLAFVEWIEVKKKEEKRNGKLVPNSQIDHTSELQMILKKRNYLIKESGESYLIFGYTRTKTKAEPVEIANT